MTAFRTISMRIRGYDEETEELSADLENISGEIADLTKIGGKGGITIFADDAKTEYKSTYQILKEISEIYDQLTDKQQAALLEKLGGKRGAQSLAPILSNFKEVERAMEEMEGAAGSAEAEMNIVRSSLDFKVNALKQTWVGVLQDLIDRGTIGDFIDALTTISEHVGDLINQFGLLGSTLGVVSGAWGMKNKTNPLALIGNVFQRGKTLGKNELEYFKSIDYLRNGGTFDLDDNGILTFELFGEQFKNGFKDLKKDGGFNDFLEIYNNLDDKAKQFAKDVALGNIELKEGETLAQGFARVYGSGVSKLGGAIKNIGMSLVNGLVSAGIGMLVGAAAGKMFDWIDGIVHREERMKEAADNAKQAIKNANDELAATTKTVDSVKDKYAELAQGVNNLGTLGQNQGKLSNEEYAEFLDISDQLAELFPRLTFGYDDNGRAILDLSGDVNTIVGSLNDLVKAEEAAANGLVLDSMDKTWGDYSNRVDDARESLNQLKSEFEGTEYEFSRSFDEQYQDFLTVLNSNGYVREQDTVSNFYTQKAFARAGLNLNGDFQTTKYNPQTRQAEVGYDFSSLTAEQIEDIKHAFSNLRSEYLAEVQKYEGTIDQANKEIATYVAQASKTVDYYDSLSDIEKQLMDSFIMNFDFDALQEQFNGSWELAYNAFQDILKDSFGSVSPADRVLIQQYYDELFSPDTEHTVEEITKLARLISEILGDEFSTDDVLSILGFDNLTDNMQTVKERLGYKSKVGGKEEAKLNQEIDNFISGLDQKDIQILAQMDFDKFHTVEEAQAALAEAQKVADENPVEIKVSAAVDSMADAKTAITSLESLYDQVVNKKAADNQATGYADPALLNSVESSFSKFIQSESDNGKDVTKLNAALENFEDTMVRFPNDADKAQGAIDDLITAYIDQTDIIKNLTEENKEWSIAQLEAYGITNAEEVVMSRLNGTSKKTIELLKKLSSTVKQYSDSLDESNKGTDDYKNAISALTGDVNNALKFYDDNTGKALEITVPEVDDSFVERHLADIQAMAEGDIQALQRVRMEATKEAIMKIYVHVPTDVAEAQVNQIMDMVAQADAMNIDVGASIDDSAFLTALSNMMKASDETADAVVAAFESMGYTVEWVPHPYTVTYVEAHQSDIKSTAAYGKMLQKAQQQIDVPDLRIKRTASGGGKTAHYAPTTPASSGGSGGGGGGGGSDSGSEPNKPKEESEESFDWIEVAIQRIEEEIARLDKVVGNSYDIWINRNTALLAEMEKTKEEIKAQQIAYKEYLRNAGEVKVNNGKGLNPDDYGENDQLVKAADQKLLDEAKKAWATGEYQNKVREGLMTGKDIEKIQNHFLSDTIKEYQTLYNQAISAQDAVQDLQIKLGDLARTNFDQAKTQAEEAISYFESYADLINERISRTEERGYFVGKNYYDQLINNEKKSLGVLRNEYDQLIKKRDDAVQKGFVSAYSEEWNNMNQEILAVGKSIEESTTNLVKFNNELRQLQWDAFDYARDRVSAFTEEFDFIIDLLDNQKLYDDYGAFNDRGWADTTLHAGKYNVYMEEALQYAKERVKIESQLAKDEGNKNLIERREELIKLQQESIKNAYAEKEAVRDLVEQGINLHLEVLQKLIDEYKDSLKSAKD